MNCWPSRAYHVFSVVPGGAVGGTPHTHAVSVPGESSTCRSSSPPRPPVHGESGTRPPPSPSPFSSSFSPATTVSSS